MFEQLMNVAAAEKLMIVSDFDGTLAGFSADPYDVPVNQIAVQALQRLAQMPQTQVVVLSGRHLEGLAQVSGITAPITLVGSHGAEGAQPLQLPADDAQRLEALHIKLEELAAQYPGVIFERKPFHIVLNTRSAQEQEEEIFARARALADGFIVMEGKCIIEFSPIEITKGTWITENRGDAKVVFLGDDVTDEHGFAALGEGDVGVKVGEGATKASLRIDDVTAVGALLDEFASLRSALVS